MKKTLVALAALAVVSAASAQSTVTMFGLIDQSLYSTKTEATVAGVTTNTNANKVQSGVSNGSRIGFKGTEDLGSGLKANFLVELSLTPDEKTADMVNRQSYVGLSGDFGAVTVGRQYTPYYNTQSALDQVGNVTYIPGYVVINHIRDSRNDNAVQYTSPNIGGFTGVFQVGAGNEVAATDTTSQTGKNYGLSAVYAAGPLVAGFALDSITTPALTPLLSKQDVWAAGASYNFGVATGAIAYSKLTAKGFLAADDKDSKGVNLSVSVPVGAAVTLSGNLGRATVTPVTGSEITVNGYQMRANYALSKRTTAYAVLGYDKFETANATSDQTKNTAYAVGVRHSF